MVSNKSNKTTDQFLIEIEKLKSQLAGTMAELNALRKGEINPKPIKENNHGQNPSGPNDSADSPDESEIKYYSVYNSMSEGMAIHEVIYNKSGKAVNYIIKDVNPAFEKITGLDKSSI